MIRHLSPETMPKPASRYSQIALAEGATRRLEISGQIGIHPDGTLAVGLAAQLDVALANVDRALAAVGMGRDNLMKITVYLTENSPDAVATYRARRDLWVGDAPPPAATLLIVAGLASPALLVEVDAVAAG
ncbi:RidA family protein [Tabrizicola caldifontis]|uniref:RidA family protein n=1 Tax=Tabrizicola caldifontis TaxID=2528036 RepID=UPI00108110F8|nr:RidA family protein [Rhodobacter sp. YIM 73028]